MIDVLVVTGLVIHTHILLHGRERLSQSLALINTFTTFCDMFAIHPDSTDRWLGI